MTTDAPDEQEDVPAWVFLHERDFVELLSTATWSEAMAEQRERLDRLLETSLAFHLSGDTVVCGRGCGVCCHQPLQLDLVDLAEVFFRHEELIRSPAFVARIDRACDDLERWRRAGGDEPRKIAEQQWQERVPCLFLSDEQACLVHPTRPLVCRNAFATVRCAPTSLETFGFANVALLGHRLRHAMHERYGLDRWQPAGQEHYLGEGLKWMLEEAPLDEMRPLIEAEPGYASSCSAASTTELKALPVPPVRGAWQGNRVVTPEGGTVELQPELIPVLRAFDGKRTFEEVCEAEDLGPAVVASLIRECSDVGLLAAPAFERLSFATPPNMRFECVRCSWCCRTFRIGPLTDTDMERLASLDAGRLGTRVDPATEQHRAPDGQMRDYMRSEGNGACVFLDDDKGLCRIHARLGEKQKPLACRGYPVRMVYVPGSLRLSLRPGCRHRHESYEGGPDLSASASWLYDLRALGLERCSPFPPWVLFLPDLATVDLAPGLPISFATYERIEAKIIGDLQQGQVEVALAAVLNGLFVSVRGADLRLAEQENARTDAWRCLRRFCQVLLEAGTQIIDDATREATKALADASSSMSALPRLPRKTQAFARELLIHEIWSLELMFQGKSVLPSLVLLAFNLILAKSLAEIEEPGEPVSPARLNDTFARTNALIGSFALGGPGALIPFAAAPDAVLVR